MSYLLSKCRDFDSQIKSHNIKKSYVSHNFHKNPVANISTDYVCNSSIQRLKCNTAAIISDIGGLNRMPCISYANQACVSLTLTMT